MKQCSKKGKQAIVFVCISILFRIKHLGPHILSVYGDNLNRAALMNHRQIKEL